MYINKLNQLYKPKRVLYYFPATEDDVDAFYKGSVKEEIARLTNAFGTYDYPGVFYLSSIQGPVIGIEYRKDDDRVDYPQGLESVDIDEAYFYSIELDNDIKPDIAYIRDTITEI